MYLATYMELFYIYIYGYVEEINEMIDYGSTTKTMKSQQQLTVINYDLWGIYIA